MIVTTKELFQIAYGNYALGAYNINNLEQTMGLFRGCMDSRAPFIIQISKGARAYSDHRMLEAIIREADDIFQDAIFAVHLDHGDEKTCYDCINSGFYSSVMIDASHETFEENVAITKRVAQAAHAKGVSVEAELGMLGGVEEHVSVDEKNACLTDPKEAKEFVAESECDSLAAAIGTSHGAYKFSGGQGLHFDVIREIKELLPGFPIVMHGSSSVPQDEVSRINAAGGKMKEGSKGVNIDEYLPAAKLGVTKINIDTDGRLVWTRVHREFFRDKPDDFDLRGPGKIFMAEYAKFIAGRNEKLGSAGQLDDVRAKLESRAVAAVAHQDHLEQDSSWALSRGSRHFHEKSDVFEALRRIAGRLRALGLPYAIVGGMALFHHGMRRFTADVALLVKARNLPADFVDRLNPYVAPKFNELWTAAQPGAGLPDELPS